MKLKLLKEVLQILIDQGQSYDQAINWIAYICEVESGTVRYNWLAERQTKPIPNGKLKLLQTIVLQG